MFVNINCLWVYPDLGKLIVTINCHKRELSGLISRPQGSVPIITCRTSLGCSATGSHNKKFAMPKHISRQEPARRCCIRKGYHPLSLRWILPMRLASRWYLRHWRGREVCLIHHKTALLQTAYLPDEKPARRCCIRKGYHPLSLRWILPMRLASRW